MFVWVTKGREMEEILEFYLKDHDFEVYVNKGCQSYNKTRDEELDNAIVREVYREMQRGGINEKRGNGGENTIGITTTATSSACDT